MKNGKVLGYWIVVAAMTVGLAAAALFKGESINPSATVRVLAVLLAGTVLLLLQSALAWAWRQFARLAPARWRDRYARDPAARLVSTENRDWDRELAQELRTKYGWRWRYCLPWVLVSGDDRRVASQLPVLARKQWCATGDVVLLWAPRSKNGLLDEAWLLKLRKLRRYRPVDAVALVFDGRAEPSALAAGSASFAALFFGITRVLRFSAPVYLVADSGIDALEAEAPEPVGWLLPRKYDSAITENGLRALGDSLALKGTRQIATDWRFRYFAALSVQIEHRSEMLTNFVATLSASVRHSLNVRGFWFLPATGGRVTTDADAAGLPVLWSEIGKSGCKSGGRRTGGHPSTICATVVAILACAWIGGMLFSGAANTRELLYANQLARQQASPSDSRSGLHALRGLQQNIERFEYRALTGAPWYSRFGLNRDQSILAGLWQTYTPAGRRLLVLPVQQGLESSLTTVAAMRTDVADPATTRQAVQGHKTLKTYLMLAEPARADAPLMEPELTRNWLTHASLTTGEQQDLAHQFFPFFAQHLPAHPDWAIRPRADLVSGTRQTLLAIMGTKNSTDTLYRSILDAAAGKYGDQTLAMLLAGTDARGLFHTSVTVPGVYRRQAFDGQIARAIDEAAARQDVSTDWTLGISSAARPRAESAEGLRRELRQMYFDDYAQHWQSFANSIQWQPAPTLSAIAEQLRLFADARQSPLIALMKTLDYQGRAGENVASLADTLVTKAQNLIGKQETAGKVAGEVKAMAPAAPARRRVRAGPASCQPRPATRQRRIQRQPVALSRCRHELASETGSDDEQRQHERSGKASRAVTIPGQELRSFRDAQLCRPDRCEPRRTMVRPRCVTVSAPGRPGDAGGAAARADKPE